MRIVGESAQAGLSTGAPNCVGEEVQLRWRDLWRVTVDNLRLNQAEVGGPTVRPLELHALLAESSRRP